MQNTFELQNLTKEEKLRIMEKIRKDLSKEGDELESPDWHQKALQETEQRLKLGKEKKIDWNTAKEELRKRFT